MSGSALPRWLARTADLRRHSHQAAASAGQEQQYNSERVPDADSKRGSGTSDPYINFKLLECGDVSETARTATKPNDPNPEWAEELCLSLPRGSSRPPLLHVQLWDDDLKKSDDPLALAETRLVPASALKTRGEMEVVLTGMLGKARGVTVVFEYEWADDDDDGAAL